MDELTTARPQSDPGDNIVRIVGYLAPQRVRGGQRDETAIGIPGRSEVRIHRFSVEVLEPEGIGSQIELEVPSVRARLGLGNLDELQEDDRIVATGRLISRNTHDLRYATEEDPNGRPTRRMLVAVTQIGKATADDTDGSIVTLDGIIAEPPSIRPHETQPAVQVGRVTLHVATESESTTPGSQMVTGTKQVIHVDIPIVGDSYKFLKAGNRLRVRGRLEVYALALRAEQDKFVQQSIAALRKSFEERMATMNVGQRLQAHKQFIRQLRTQQTEMRLRVRAQEVTLVEGEPVESIDQIFETRREYAQRVTEERRERRANARRRNRGDNRATANDGGRDRSTAAQLVGETASPSVVGSAGGEGGAEAQPGAGGDESTAAKPVRHHKHARPDASAAT